MGEALAPFKGKVVIATKFGIKMVDGKQVIDSKPEHIRQSVEGSRVVPISGALKLERLKENLGAEDVELTLKELSDLSDQLSKIKVSGDRYPAGYENTKKSIEESLKKLQLDYLDLLLIHQPFSDYYSTYRAMEDLYKEGKIKAIGVSNFYPDKLIDLIQFNDFVPSINQVETHPFNQQVKANEIMEKYGVQIENWALLLNGKMICLRM